MGLDLTQIELLVSVKVNLSHQKPYDAAFQGKNQVSLNILAKKI